MIVALAVLALVLGLAYGLLDLENFLITVMSQHTDIVLYILMFCVGVSIGARRGIVARMREYHIKIFIIPIGVMIGSVAGGLLCAAILGMPLNQGMAVASGMGWYSLSGATISRLAGAELGSIAFMSNLMREIFSFFIIPFLASCLNYYACIASAGATSEDTTLPVILKYTNEETVVLSVVNGVICSFFVPILIALWLPR